MIPVRTPAQRQARKENALATTVVAVTAVLASGGAVLLAEWFAAR